MLLTLWVFLLGLTLHRPEQRQQEPKLAPTAEVCKADAAVWWSHDVAEGYSRSRDQLASGGKYIPNLAGDLSWEEVAARMHEMYDCIQVDKEDEQSYRQAFEFYWGVRMERYERFIQRHGLMEKFWKEDARGLR
jgi:hypothetical protein